MKFWLQQTSKYFDKDVVENHPGSFLDGGRAYIMIDTIEELLGFVKKYNTEVVIGMIDLDEHQVFYLEHYDKFRE